LRIEIVDLRIKSKVASYRLQVAGYRLQVKDTDKIQITKKLKIPVN